jgi:N-acetylglucosamine kinase-like BadF-type ATPase
MNILVADSGATKTHWELVNTQTTEQKTFYTKGISPFYMNEADIVDLLKNELGTFTSVKNIYFYGTGCSQVDKVQVVKNALNTFFQPEKIYVEHDLLAAAKATCKKNKGITCILGTGSNSCLFDGVEIIDNIPSLGFLLGDEGSGAWFGRKLLQAYFYRELPPELHTAFSKKYPFSKDEILNKIYGVKNPNSVVATYMPFLSEHNNHEYVKQLLRLGFDEFVSRTVLKYENHEQLPIHFIGSVAFLNKDILKASLQHFSLTIGEILKSPMEGLIAYHLEN